MTCTTHTYWHCYLCTFPRTIKTGIGTCCGSSIHSFHSILEFLIWHSTFGAITFYQFWFLIFFKVFLSFSPYPRNHFKINLKKILSFVTFFCLTEKWYYHCIKSYHNWKKKSNFDSKWTLRFIQRGVPDFLLRRYW